MKINMLQKVLCALLVGGSLTVGCIAEAAIDTGKLPLQTYVAKRVYCGNSPGATSNSYWIDANKDLVTIKQYSGEWAYGTYPNSKGKPVTRWFRMSDVLGNVNFSNYETNMKQRQIVYRTESSGQTIGTVFDDENVVVVYEGSSRTQIIYRLSNNKGYKMGWVPNSSINKKTSYSSEPYRQQQPTGTPTNPIINNNISRPANNINTNVTPNTNAVGYQQWQGTANKRGYAYKDSALKARYANEWVDKGDIVTVLDEAGEAFYVEYEGRYRGKPQMKKRWVSKSVIDRTSNNNGSSVNSVLNVINNNSYVWPIDDQYTVTTLYYYMNTVIRGSYKHSCKWSHFNALDISAPKGTAVRSVSAGRVVESKFVAKTGGSGFGNYIIIEHPDGTRSLYAHLREVLVSKNDTVEANQLIAKSGDTGNGGAHLHFEFSNLNAWEVYRSKAPLVYCKTTLSAYEKRCVAADKSKFKEAIDWINSYGGGFTVD